jgi:hypothetical protein
MWLWAWLMRRRAVVFGVVIAVAAVIAFWLWPARGQPPGPASAGLTDSAPDRPDAGQARGATALGTRVRPSLAPDAGHPLDGAADAVVLARFEWGSGPLQLGRERQVEGNPEGPMSVAVGPDGQVWLLDQVNQRLVKLDASGNRSTVPLPVQAAQDVVVTKDGTALVMDRLVDKTVAIIGPDGKPRGELPLEGKGLTEGGASTGLFTDGDDVLVEREHGDLVRIGSTTGKADPDRGDVPGRPSKDGASYLTASLANAASGTVTVTAVARSTLEHRFTRQVSFGQPLMSLVMLDSDASGFISLGALVEGPGSTAELPAFAISVLCLDGVDGQPVGRTSFGANTVAEESFKELTVSPDGTILFLRRTEQGAQLERHRCQ